MLISKVWIGKSASLVDYPFDFKSMLITLTMLIVVLSVLNMINIIKVTFQSPLKLVDQNVKSQGKHLKFYLYCIGIGHPCDSTGYSIALQDNSAMGSLASIFVAMFCVFLGTYFLFISLSVVILDCLKNTKILL